MQPPYLLRPKKHIDRMMMVDLLRYVLQGSTGSDWRYISPGGPTLEDHSLMHRVFPDMDLVSLEMDPNILARQRFHKPTCKLEIHNDDILKFMDGYDHLKKTIVWLDLFSIDTQLLASWTSLIELLPTGSVLRATVAIKFRGNRFWERDEMAIRNGEWTQPQKSWWSHFSTLFSDYLPREVTAERLCSIAGIASVISTMFKRAADRVSNGRKLVLAGNWMYRDGDPMLSITGIVADDCSSAEATVAIQNTWHGRGCSWNEPRTIAIPFLSVKERKALNSLLPQKNPTGKSLYKRLGHILEETEDKTVELLKSYANFYRDYPDYLPVTV